MKHQVTIGRNSTVDKAKQQWNTKIPFRWNSAIVN